MARRGGCAQRRIENKLTHGEITAEEAALCRKWSANSRVRDFLPRLIDPEVLDRVWSAYEGAIAADASG